MPHHFSVSAALCLTLSLLAFPAAAGDPGERLIAAAQRQDAAAVRALLAAGVDVDSTNRYGATALTYACDKGNVEIVKLLLEAGAEVEVTDTFYKTTPLGWTLWSIAESPAHRQIAYLLLERGADPAAALRFGARGGDLELVEAALELGEVEPAALRSALKVAAGAGHAEIVALLEPLVPAEAPEETVTVAPERLAAYAGNYKNDDIGMSSKVWVEDGRLTIQAPGQDALTLDPTAEDTFTAREIEGAEFEFRGRGGTIEGFQLRQGGQELFFPRVETEPAAVAEATTPLPPLERAERGEPKPWPRFRGEGAAGIGDGQGAPATWDAESGENVRWKTPVPGLAHSSPIVWGDRIFLTSAASDGGDESLRTGLYGDVDSVDDDSPHAWRVLALDKDTGKISWQRTASEGQPKSKRHLKSTHANPTPATDGEHLVAHFGSEGLFCYRTDGTFMWHQPMGVLASGWFYDSTYEWGFSSSPILHDGKVITQIDVDKGSFIAAYDLGTGRQLWKTSRDEIPTWGTPAVLPAATRGAVDEIVTNGTIVRGYHAGSGEELWRLAPNSEITVASPVISGGLAYVTGGYPPVRPIYALRPGGRGDLTLPEGETASDHVAWSQARGGTYIPTPIVYRGLLYMLHNSGRLTVHDAATGEELYRQRVGKSESFSGSPVAADGRLYFTTEEGTTYVVRAGRAYEVLGTNDLGEVVMTTPAISGGLMVIRGARHVYGLGEPPTAEGQTEATSSPP